MNLWDKISSLIAEEKGKAEGQQPAPPEQPEDARAAAGVGLEGAAGRPALSPADANTVLGMLPKGQSLDQFSAGQIQLLNIESVRADLGDRWSKFEHQVHLLVEATLRRMLTEADIFTQISEYEYLVIFPNLTEQKASALMYVAAAQIRQKLFGYDPAFAAIRLNATVTRVSGDLAEKAADPIAAVHEAALLGGPAEPTIEAPPEQPLTPLVVPWTDKYKIVPIEGGNMTRGRLVADAAWSGKPQPDFSSVADPSQAPAQSDPSSANTAGDSGSKGDQPAEVPGYAVFHVTGGDGKAERRLVTDEPRTASRMPDFSSMRAGPPVRRSNTPGGATGTGQESKAPADPAPMIEGYRVFQTTGGGSKEGRLVQDAPRSPTRVPDFTQMNAAPSQSPNAGGAQPKSQGASQERSNVHQPTLAARVDALAAKPAPMRAVPIARPTETRPAGTDRGASDKSSAPVEIEELQLLYEPIWDVSRQAVTAYRMKISLKVESALLGLTEFCLTYDDPKLQSTLNSMILRKLVSQMQAMRGESKRAIVVAPIGRRFIEDQSNLRLLLDQLSVLNDQERQLIVLEIGDAYIGSWPTLTPRVAVIRRVCRNIGVRLSLDQRDFQQVAVTGATMVAGDLSDHDWPERQTLGALNAFAAAASRVSLRSFIGGLATSSMVIAAVGAGFNHLSGSAIGGGTPVPIGVYPLSTEGFYLQRQAQRLQQDQGKQSS
jgi:hypothetical protein